MSSFLELAQDLRLDSGVSGSGPSSTTNQTGMDARMVKWINRSWLYIQQLYPDWRWMNSNFSFEAVVGKSFTPAAVGAANFSRWTFEHGDFTCYETSEGETDQTYLNYINHIEWADKYQFAGGVGADRPVDVSVDPQTLSLLIAPEPDTSYTVQGTYQKSATELSGDSDIPAMPVEFHRLIVDKALMYVAAYLSSSELFTTATMDFKEGLSRLELNQKPMMTISRGSLA